LRPVPCILTALSLGFLALSTPTWGQTKTGQFAVRASVNADCQVTTRDLDFGVYSSGSNARSSTSLDVKCTPGASVTISLDGGGSGNPQARVMQGPGATLGYQLYKDNAYQQPITTGGMAFQLTSAQNTGQTANFPLYGQIPAGQAVPGGNYTDTVRVTITY